eukprot:GHVU01176346.1.p1 GENE.GHVU01176346.1~~GHVU01176346.1.p1  ORF type:complete len:518 (-),score=62.27 GHVU01176346.1:772-2325(-)
MGRSHNGCLHIGPLEATVGAAVTVMEAACRGGSPCTASRASTPPQDRWRNVWVLAPMVKIGLLPFRLECLRYGADRVYTEELLDHRLIGCSRVVNSALGTIEYVSRDAQDRREVVFSTIPTERDHLSLQLGTANAQDALRAALLVERDVSIVDVNMGCPKSFSVNKGMGAALLRTPDRVADILTTLRRNLTTPITCKIRLLPDTQQTIDFARMCERCGVEAIAVHARLPSERPRHSARWAEFQHLRAALQIPIVANGDLLSIADINAFVAATGIDALMLARAAMWNPAIFTRDAARTRPENKLTVLQSYFRQAADLECPFPSMRFTLGEMTSADSPSPFKGPLKTAKSIADLARVLRVEPPRSAAEKAALATAVLVGGDTGGGGAVAPSPGSPSLTDGRWSGGVKSASGSSSGFEEERKRPRLSPVERSTGTPPLAAASSSATPTGSTSVAAAGGRGSRETSAGPDGEKGVAGEGGWRPGHGEEGGVDTRATTEPSRHADAESESGVEAPPSKVARR